MIFEWLPEVDKCCFCIPLKVGCIIISVYCLLSISGLITHYYIYADIIVKGNGTDADEVYELYEHSCFSNLHNKTCVQHSVTKPAFISIFFVADVLLMIASVIFIIGIIVKKVITATIFLYTYTFTSLPIFLLLLFFLGASVLSTCKGSAARGVECLSDLLFYFIVSFYILVVVKSYRTVMREEE